MIEYLECAKKQFESEGSILIPNVYDGLIDSDLSEFANLLKGKFLFANVSLPRVVSNVLNAVTGVQVTEGKLFELSHRDYKLIDENPAVIFAVLELTPAWESSFGASVVVADGEGEHMEVPFNPGSLFITRDYPLWYISYCNHNSGGKRRFVVIRY